MPETFVDVSSRGLEVGSRLHLSEIGPTSGYIEHSLPMPVGAELRVEAGEGVDFGVVVVRVQEQVGGAERPPGMFVRVVEMSQAAEAWWKEHATRTDDFVFPEPEAATPAASSAPAPSTPDQRATLEMSAEELESITGDAPPAGGDIAATMKMSADQIAAITDEADAEGESGNGESEAAAPAKKPKAKGKKKRRSRRNTSRR